MRSSGSSQLGVQDCGLGDPHATHHPNMSTGTAERRFSRISTTSDVPGSEPAQANQTTFMGVPLSDLRKDSTPKHGPSTQSLRDAAVLPRGSFWCRAPTITEFLTWSKVANSIWSVENDHGRLHCDPR